MAWWLLGGVTLAGPTPVTTSNAPVTLTDFKLVGNLGGDLADFTLTANAHVEGNGGKLDLLSGPVALTAISNAPGEHISASQNHFLLTFDRKGVFPVTVRFSAAVRQADGWNTLDFHVAPSVLQPVVLQGLPAETQFQFAGAARPERSGGDFLSYLPAGGAVNFSWKEARPETEGKLFFSAEMLSQINVLPGLMRQTAAFNFKVMQGELTRVSLLLHGPGEVTQVRGDSVLKWDVEPVEGSPDRRLVVQLNQPQKDQLALLVQSQTQLGTFPQTADALEMRPENATRFGGYFRIVNEGAVRLEVAQARGMSQISPDQFPENDATRALFRAAGNQRFVYRFAGADFALRVQADQILPELAVSEKLAYHTGENELVIDAEFELDIREAPLRELLVRIPRGWAIERLNAPGTSDYFVTVLPDNTNSELRMVYGQPMSGRQLVQLRLERNQGLDGGRWELPRVEVEKAKSLRGFIGAASDPGFRLSVEQSQGLTDIATAFFPGKLDGLQTAFRLTDTAADSAWQATIRVERLPQTVQASALHLYSIGEGIAYGSSLINYVVSGAPVGSFQVELSDEYLNVEFTGKDIRTWQRTNGGYVAQLHTPVSGAYTLLATYDRPFKAQGETLLFTGARPLDAQSEQGYTLVISDCQFQVEPTDVSPGLLRLEPAEVPAEYRLFFDAPILAAYRYAARPFNLRLALTPLAQGDSVSQIVDRATYQTRISKQGQVLTTARYFIKNRGNPNFRLTIPPGSQLWSASINGVSAVPVSDGNASLVPLPQSADPNAVLELNLTLASQSKDPENVTVSVPEAAVPVMLAEWKMAPDPGRRLSFTKGSLLPAGAEVDLSGFAQLSRLLTGSLKDEAMALLFGIFISAISMAAVWRWGSRPGVCRYDAAYVFSLLIGLGALAVAVGCVVQLTNLAGTVKAFQSTDLTFLAPVQRAGSTLQISVSNVADNASTAVQMDWIWPAVVALVLWIGGLFMRIQLLKSVTAIAGWTLLAWGALRIPNGVPVFFWILPVFILVHVLLPGLVRLSHLPRRPATQSAPGAGAAPATVALLALGFYALSSYGNLLASDAKNVIPPAAMPDSVTQMIRVEDKLALATAKIRWQAVRGQTLPLLSQPAVMTHVVFPAKSLQLEAGSAGSKYSQQIVALENGVFDIEEQYEIAITPDSAGGGFVLPAPYGLINRLNLTIVNADVDVFSAQAVSIKPDHDTTNTVATIVLSPSAAQVNWRPRSRDVKQEKALFYADLTQIFAPSGGVVEGAHLVSIRPAQGELSELNFNVPSNATVTDVIYPNQPYAGGVAPAPAWRFDPDMRKLRVTLNPPLSRSFTLMIWSQVATATLPFEQTLGLISVDNAAGQRGDAGVATTDEVQLDNVASQGLAAINLEDFTMDASSAFRGQIPGLTLRRAFQYSGTNASITLKASAVEPDVRIETRDTLSLGEDHTTLADSFTVDITRAGIFNLSFVMPKGFDVDSISGAALSQWTESQTNDDRIITLHLNGKTIGTQEFAITLAGPGVKTARGWKVPQIILREAGKQRGTLLIVPEQGMGLQASAREGYLQLDPQKSGIHTRGVLAFSLLQVPSNLTLDIDQVDPWIEVTSLQHADVREAQIKTTANLVYQIKNAGLKGFRVYLPTNAESVRFQGDQVTDFLKMTNAVTNGWQEWEVKLDRRVIGQYLLQVTYQNFILAQASEATLWSVQAAEVNVQHGFVTVQSAPRLQVTVDHLPSALQLAEWQSIPRLLEKDLTDVSATLTCSLLDPVFQLPLKLERHEAAKLLPAHVNNITFNSVISDDGVMLTQARLEILPGDKRLLGFTLPTDAKFWFAFVNDNGVWPWREKTNILIPLEQQSHGDRPVVVEIFYGCRTGTASADALNLELLAPKFDLPLENITWRVSLGDKWHVNHWDGSLQFQSEAAVPQSAALDPQIYLRDENTLRQARTEEARNYYALGNSSLEKGNPQMARRAFEAAYGLSTHDAAFNEDARVQLHNIKLQQALVGLNASQSAVAGDGGALGGKLRDLRNRPELNYTQQDAKDIIDNNSADENAAYVRLAEKLIQQQDAAINHPAGIRASIPEQGRVLTFQRAVAVDPWEDLRIGLNANVPGTISSTARAAVLVATLLAFGMIVLAVRSLRPPRAA